VISKAERNTLRKGLHPDTSDNGARTRASQLFNVMIDDKRIRIVGETD
jgi:hypothetical protein